jgi:amino acid permease
VHFLCIPIISPYAFKRYLGWNIGIVTFTVTLGILASGIDLVLGLVGSTCSPMMMFVMPAAFYLGALRKQQLASLHEDEEVQSLSSFFWDELYAFLLLCWGLALIPCCTAVWAMSL